MFSRTDDLEPSLESQCSILQSPAQTQHISRNHDIGLSGKAWPTVQDHQAACLIRSRMACAGTYCAVPMPLGGMKPSLIGRRTVEIR